MIELKRAAELNIVAHLKLQMPAYSFFPSRGGDDLNDATSPEPPFGVVIIDENEQTLASDVWMLHGHVVWISHSQRETVQQASTEARQVLDALKILPSGYDATHSIMVHGFDVNATGEFQDADRLARGDTIAFNMGVTQG